MTVTRYAATRALTLSLRRGDDVLVAVVEALSTHGIGQAWITARGTFDEIELRDAGQQRTFATTSRIISFDGRARAPGDTETPDGEILFAATVARPSPRGPEILMGDVLRAVAHEVEVLITALEPVAVAREENREPERGNETEQRSPKPSRADDPWAIAAAASAETEADEQASKVAARIAASRAAAVNKGRPVPAAIAALPKPAAPVPPKRKEMDDAPYPEEGDVIEHFAFGRGNVLRSDGDELLVHDTSSGRTRTLRLGVLTITGPFEEEGKKLYRLRQRRTTT